MPTKPITNSQKAKNNFKRLADNRETMLLARTPPNTALGPAKSTTCQ